MKRLLYLILAIGFLVACSKKDDTAPEFGDIDVNGATDHFFLEAGVSNTIRIALKDESLFQLRCTISKQGTIANHDEHTTASYFGMLIPNHGDFALDTVRNINGSEQTVTINFNVPLLNSGLWLLRLQALDNEGNLQTWEEDVMINSSAYPILSLVSMNEALTIGDGKITAPAGTPWQWQGDIYDLDTLQFIHITVMQSGDTVFSYLLDDVDTWTMDLQDNFPMSMPTETGQYQFKVRMADINGVETYRNSTLVVQ
jgi:hypothetical protein